MHIASQGSGDKTTTISVDIQVWVDAWGLSPDGDAFTTHSSDLLPARTATGVLAMLKLPREQHERRGSVLMQWWQGEGAARVLQAGPGGVLLLERAMGTGSLARMARDGDGDDDAATAMLCDAVAVLHAPRERPWPADLLPLESWFRQLEPMARREGGVLQDVARIAGALLAEPSDVVPLHGDLHHDNVLDFGPQRGWLAIDPKSLLGERGFDYANIFTNPQEPDRCVSDVALRPGRFGRRLEIVSAAAGLQRSTLLQWIAAYTGLSAAWIIGDGHDASLDLGILQLALGALRG